MFIKIYLIALPIFFLIDIIWLAFVARNFYIKNIGFLMSNTVNWWAAIIFYLIFIFGLVLFVIYPSILKESLSQALILGALFGFIAYATYDLTNLATIKDWPLLVTIVDLIWGTFLGAAVSSLTYLIFIKIL